MAGRPKGLPKTGGRQKGAPNKMTGLLKDAILGALTDAGGQAYLLKQAKENPVAFMTLLGKVLPSDINVAGNVGVPLAYVVTPDKAASMQEWTQSLTTPLIPSEE